MRVTRGIAVLSLTTVAVLGLSACSSDTDPKPERGSSTSAAEEVVEQEAAGSDLTAEDFVARVTAATREQGTVTIEMVSTMMGASTTATGQVEYVADGQQMAMSMGSSDPAAAGAGEIELRVVDGIVYMSMGELTQGKFIQIDPDDASDPLASSFSGTMDQLDPTAALVNLEGAIVSLEKAGEPEERGGALAQPYDLTVDTAAAGLTPEEAGAEVPAQVTYTYWVDADDLLRAMSMDVEGATVEMTFSGWGEPVDITAPTADQITEMPAF